jgi:hypothetical protein
MNFKEALANDLDNTFLNTETFADEHLFNGQKIKIVVDDDRLDSAQGSYNNGVFSHLTEVYVKDGELEVIPTRGQEVNLDGRTYVVRSVSVEYGVNRIVLSDVEQ